MVGTYFVDREREREKGGGKETERGWVKSERKGGSVGGEDRETLGRTTRDSETRGGGRRG